MVCRSIQTKALKEKALSIHRDLELSGSFQASNGWLENFKRRHGLTSRRVTGHAQKLPIDLPDQAKLFWAQVHDTGNKDMNIKAVDVIIM